MPSRTRGAARRELESTATPTGVLPVVLAHCRPDRALLGRLLLTSKPTATLVHQIYGARLRLLARPGSVPAARELARWLRRNAGMLRSLQLKPQLRSDTEPEDQAAAAHSRSDDNKAAGAAVAAALQRCGGLRHLRALAWSGACASAGALLPELRSGLTRLAISVGHGDVQKLTRALARLPRLASAELIFGGGLFGAGTQDLARVLPSLGGLSELRALQIMSASHEPLQAHELHSLPLSLEQLRLDVCCVGMLDGLSRLSRLTCLDTGDWPVSSSEAFPVGLVELCTAGCNVQQLLPLTRLEVLGEQVAVADLGVLGPALPRLASVRVLHVCEDEGEDEGEGAAAPPDAGLGAALAPLAGLPVLQAVRGLALDACLSEGPAVGLEVAHAALVFQRLSALSFGLRLPPAALAQLPGTLAQLPALSCLTLHNACVAGAGADNAALLSGLSGLGPLRRLAVSSAWDGPAIALDAAVGALAACTQLLELELSRSDLTSAGLVPVLLALTGLHRLELWRNPGVLGTAELAAAVKALTRLTSLAVDGPAGSTLRLPSVLELDDDAEELEGDM